PALAPHDAARGLDRERGAGDVAVIVEPLREDAQPVTRLLRLAAVGIEDAHAGVRAIARHVHEHTVPTHAAMPIAEAARTVGVEDAARKVSGAHDEVVVAEPVALD